MNNPTELRAKFDIYIVLIVLCITLSSFGKVIYVDVNANGLNNGASWSNAYTYLQDALLDAAGAEKAVVIKVAQGKYHPDLGAGQIHRDRTATFQLINGVTLQGGYAGAHKTDPNVRDVKLNVTILSGDIHYDDSDPAESGWRGILAHPIYHWQLVDDMIRRSHRNNNSYTVVTADGTDPSAVLDGFTISSGHADGNEGPWDSHQVNGAGMYNKAASPTILNCTFLRNTTCGYDRDTYGAGMFNSDSNPVVRNSSFIQNIAWGANASSSGGGVFDANSTPVFSNCTFHGNMVDGFDSDYYGPAIHDFNSTTTLEKCMFIRNLSRGSAIMLAGSELTMSHCLFTGHSGAVSTQIWFQGTEHESSLRADSCIFADNIVGEPGRGWSVLEISYSNIIGGHDGAGNIDGDPCFVNPGYFHDNGTPDDSYDDLWIEGDDYHLKSQAGRWDPKNECWVKDNVTSSCIDAGNVMSPVSYEPFPNGGIVNMGTYGGSAEASKSYFGSPVCETIITGDINGDCKIDYRDFLLLSLHWLEDTNP